MQKVIRSFILLLSIALSTSMLGQEWSENYEEAQGLAKITSKPILLVFSGSDWCVPCMKLEREIWEHDAFIEYANSELILLKADFPRRKKNQLSDHRVEANKKLADTYNPEGFFPLVVLLDENGQVLGKTGYKKVKADEYITHLEKLIKG